MDWKKDNADAHKRFGKGGLNKFDGEKFTHFPEVEGLNESDVYAIYLDRSGCLWVSTTSHGIYKYENKEFVNYHVPNSTMSFLNDKTGNIWLGCAGGLYRLNADTIINVTADGPWK